jgi:sulfite reductase (ferredoxin)
MLDVSIDNQSLVDPAQLADIDKFEAQLERFQAGQIDDDVFRVFRLTNGIYGQRQGGTSQMLRIKIPYGQLSAAQLDAMGTLATQYSRGWGHITTRQNMQFHFVELNDVPQAMRLLASVGLSTREACGDTVRNVQGCHLAGACPLEILDITPWAEATFRHFIRNPICQRMPRKFKINFSGCDTDCGQAMFNDVGVIAVKHPETQEAGFRLYVAGGLGTTPHPALAFEPFTSREDLLPTIESLLRVFDRFGNRDNKLRARMKWLVDQLGWDELVAAVKTERKFLVASSSWPGGIPEVVEKWGDAPAGSLGGDNVSPIGQGAPVTLVASAPFSRWKSTNVVRGEAKGTLSAYASVTLGDITAEQFHGLAALQRELGSDVRVTNRQNLVFRDLTEDQLDRLFDGLDALEMARAGAELSRDVVACPGADTCNLAVTQSRGLADAIGAELEEQGLAEVGGIRINISGCPNSCGQHHIADIGFMGAERRAHGNSAPGYQMLLGGYVGQEKIHFGDKALRLPAKNAPKAAASVIGQYNDQREANESFRGWLDRVGGAEAIAGTLKDLDHFPTPDEGPEFYTDFGETGPYVAEVGESECAT